MSLRTLSTTIGRRALLRIVIVAAGFGLTVADAAPPVMNMAMPAATSASADGATPAPSVRAFKAADDKMMSGMNAGYSGDADRDFVAHMIPHHQGAIDMAKVELQYGKDPALRKLARQIVKAQDGEILLMKQWQARHGVSGDPSR